MKDCPLSLEQLEKALSNLKVIPIGGLLTYTRWENLFDGLRETNRKLLLDERTKRKKIWTASYKYEVVDIAYVITKEEVGEK